MELNNCVMKTFPFAFKLFPVVSLLFAGACASKPQKAQAPALMARDRVTSNAPARPPRPPLDEILLQASAKPSLPFEGEGWTKMSDDKTLSGWRETGFAGRGEVQSQFGLIILNTGDPFTGINWTNDFPKLNYEIALDAMRVTGSDFFCGLTVPVGTNSCSLIVGGWGGSLLGISSLDSMDASENETTKFMNFEQDRWYRVRLRVTENRLEAWIDKEKLVDVVTTGKRISVRPGDIELSRPIGLSAWQTTGAFRNIRWRAVTGPAGPPKQD